MNRRSAVVAVMIAGFVLSIPGLASAAGQGKAAKKDKSLVWVVASVDTNASPNTITIAREDKKKETKTCEVKATTEIIVNGAAGKLEDIKVGMKAEVTLAEAPGFVLAQIKASDYKAPADPKKNKKNK
jgi:hypothetical protein